uniref:HAD family hydrolase n=1 Tax=Collinsella sp. TaxID=1965294 RepID=UPI004029F1F2
MNHIAAPSVAFIFDCDGTLVNSSPVWGHAQTELLRRHGIDVTVDDFAQFEHLSLEDECQAYHDTWGIGANGEELYLELSDILIDGYSKVPPREGLLAFLEQAKAAGIAMCVATSTPAELVQSALASAGLDRYMEFITTTGEAGRSKQFSDVYELALRRLEERHGHKFERAWVFEDAVFGLKSSGTVGFKRVGIYDPHGRMERDEVRTNCDIFIDSYEDLDLAHVLEFEG